MPAYAKGGSNLRDTTAQVNHLYSNVIAGMHDGCAVWCGTDNAVWSYVWHKIMLTIKHLFRKVLELKIECHCHEVYLCPFHISGGG